MKTLLLVALLVGLPMQAHAAQVFYFGNELVSDMREYDKGLAGQPGVNYRGVGMYLGYVITAYEAFDISGG